MATCNVATAHLCSIISLAPEREILCSSLQFIAIISETQDYGGFKLPLCQSTNELHQGLRICQGKIRHILAGSVKLYQTLAFPGNSTTVCAENAHPLHRFSSCVGLFLSRDTPIVVLCIKGISHLIPSSLPNLQPRDLEICSLPTPYEV